MASFDRSPDDDYIVLACDGLWDTLSFDNLVTEVHTYLEKGDRSEVAQRLIRVAKENGSSDNITAIVVFLRDNIGSPVQQNSTEKEGDSNDDAFGGKPDDDRRKSDGSHGGDEDPGRDGGEKGRIG